MKMSEIKSMQAFRTRRANELETASNCCDPPYMDAVKPFALMKYLDTATDVADKTGCKRSAVLGLRNVFKVVVENASELEQASKFSKPFGDLHNIQLAEQPLPQIMWVMLLERGICVLLQLPI